MKTKLSLKKKTVEVLYLSGFNTYGGTGVVTGNAIKSVCLYCEDLSFLFTGCDCGPVDTDRECASHYPYDCITETEARSCRCVEI